MDFLLGNWTDGHPPPQDTFKRIKSKPLRYDLEVYMWAFIKVTCSGNPVINASTPI